MGQLYAYESASLKVNKDAHLHPGVKNPSPRMGTTGVDIIIKVYY